MTSPTTTRTSRWLICEPGDRWYRGVCRYAPGIARSESALRIERIVVENANSILSRIKAANDQVVVLWELPEFQVQPADFLARLDLISAIRLESSIALQVAWLSPVTPIEAVLSAQEAGIAFFLQGLWSLPGVGKAVSRHFSPLG